MPPEPSDGRLLQNYTVRWFVLLFGVPTSYAIFRYHIFGGVDWAHLPLFIANKAISLSAVFFIAISYLIGKTIRAYNDEPAKRLILIKFCGLMGFSLAAIHALMALCVLNPAYFGKYFAADGRLNWIGELGMTVGIIGLWALTMPAIATLPTMAKDLGGWRWKRAQRMGYLCLLLVATHLIVLGWRGWMAPSKWQWGLPPISLLAVAAALVALVVKMRRLRGK
jgi:DMSO/TMAO reductase YedYZ heme-binding membrane subunit